MPYIWQHFICGARPLQKLSWTSGWELLCYCVFDLLDCKTNNVVLDHNNNNKSFITDFWGLVLTDPYRRMEKFSAVPEIRNILPLLTLSTFVFLSKDSRFSASRLCLRPHNLPSSPFLTKKESK